MNPLPLAHQLMEEDFFFSKDYKLFGNRNTADYTSEKY